MQAGRLRHRVVVQSMGEPIVEPGGGFTETPITVATVWASIEPATSRSVERRVGAQVEATITHLVTMRYLAGVTTKMRLLFGLRVFQIRGLQNLDERNVMLTLACEERQ